MNIIPALILLAIEACRCQDIKEVFEKINEHTESFNAKAADLTWESSIKPDNTKLVYESAILQRENIAWQHRTCEELERLQSRQWFNRTQIRQKYLLCRGPKYTYEEARLISVLYDELQSIYTGAEVCIPTETFTSPNNLTGIEVAIMKHLKLSNDYFNRIYRWPDSTMFPVKKTTTNIRERYQGICLKGEDDFQNVMACSRKEEVLKYIWLVWREKVGPPMKELYRKFVEVENMAARRNGYSDIGASWREEQEMPNLRQTCRSLYEKVKPFYTLLHGVVRFFLRDKYGDIVPETGPIPAHLLGDLWSQNWEPLADLMTPKTIDLDESITKLNWTVHHMVKRAEDFYLSLGLPPMTDKFWNKSVFSRENNETKCHGTAADMFKTGDFRLLYCSGKRMKDFYVFHHELGHIQYYMAYEHQPALFRQANMALHEAMGDTIMHGVMTPLHLHRLGLINDSLLYDTNKLPIGKSNTTQICTENQHKMISDPEKWTGCKESHDIKKYLNISPTDILLLKQALNRIPQIPFSLLIDEYRWKYFEGDFSSLDINKRFWQMALEFQGIAPSMKRGAFEFDVGAKFHVPDNTPYIRYFLSSFLQNQLFESLCKAAVFGRRGVKDALPDTITMNRCDIYGSKAAGKLLKDIMSRGHSQHWQEILQETTGQDHISAAPLLRYYRPLQGLLEKLVHLHRIPIGW